MWNSQHPDGVLVYRQWVNLSTPQHWPRDKVVLCCGQCPPLVCHVPASDSSIETGALLGRMTPTSLYGIIEFLCTGKN